MTSRRFPPPWTVEETAPCFIVRDHNGQALAFVYCEDEPAGRITGKLLKRDEARRIFKPNVHRRTNRATEPKLNNSGFVHSTALASAVGV
jgi:hypothetical protein